MQDAVVEGENIIGNRNGDLIKPTTQKTNRRNILRVDVSKLTQQGQQGVLGTAFGGVHNTCSNIKVKSSVLRSFKDHLEAEWACWSWDVACDSWPGP